MVLFEGSVIMTVISFILKDSFQALLQGFLKLGSLHDHDSLRIEC